MIYIPDINENDYLTGGGPPTKKTTQKIENCLVDGDIFIIKIKVLDANSVHL